MANERSRAFAAAAVLAAVTMMVGAEEAMRSYEGRWVLVPELSFYEEGEPPASGLYVITVDGGEVRFRIDWSMADAEAQSIEFGGPLDGEPRADGAPPGARVSFTHVAAGVLDSAVHDDVGELAYARRKVSADGSLLAVLQRGRRPDGGRFSNTQVYRRD